ncbi:hypothetical protein [Streptomyces sp. H39-S7]|uniref:hypothetical protein n=1 Tax=Streptomyces sp. H39-S7 TaxID=3004357 RepID=UPI0022AF1698|nr:hypothetical protein [Streptomyces sp. H39-S7]MCZ4120267.1 hypothetical protein [Streptomyces sp. H39-S7]
MRKHRRRQKARGGLAGGRVLVVPQARSQRACEPGIEVSLNVGPGPAGQLITSGFIAHTGLRLLQGALLAQRLQFVSTSRGAGGFAQFGVPSCDGCGVCRELVLDDDVVVRVVHAADGGEQLGDPLPLSEFGRPPLIEGQILIPCILPILPTGVLERGHSLAVRHATGATADRAAPHLRPVDHRAGHGRCSTGLWNVAVGGGHAHQVSPICQRE